MCVHVHVCVLRVSECVCAYVCVQSASVFHVPGMRSVKASKQSLYIEQGAWQTLLREKPVRDAGKLQSSPQSSVPSAPEHLSIDITGTFKVMAPIPLLALH